MLLTYRFGVVASSSSLVHVTAEARLALTFFEMNTRPRLVAAQAVFVSPVDRSTAVMAVPARSPQNASVSGFAPKRAQSPHVWKSPPGPPSPVHSLHAACASA